MNILQGNQLKKSLTQIINEFHGGWGVEGEVRMTNFYYAKNVSLLATGTIAEVFNN